MSIDFHNLVDIADQPVILEEGHRIGIVVESLGDGVDGDDVLHDSYFLSSEGFSLFLYILYHIPVLLSTLFQKFFEKVFVD